MPGATVKIAGDGPEGPALRAAADPRVVFEPFRGPPSDHLRELDVYVLPSSWEAFPIGVLEAMACGVPQVATDVGGTREAVTPESGMLVPPRDATALADAVIELLRDPQRRARMRRGVARACTRSASRRADGRRRRRPSTTRCSRQYAPRPEITAGSVARRISMSRASDQPATYW